MPIINQNFTVMSPSFPKIIAEIPEQAPKIIFIKYGLSFGNVVIAKWSLNNKLICLIFNNQKIKKKTYYYIDYWN
jgi:hypothetical protein